MLVCGFMSVMSVSLFVSSQEAQKIFSAKFTMDREFVATKVKFSREREREREIVTPVYIILLQLKGYGVSVITEVDPNVDNFVSAGIINTRSTLIGCLLRLEPNKETKVSSAHKTSSYCTYSQVPLPQLVLV